MKKVMRFIKDYGYFLVVFIMFIVFLIQVSINLYQNDLQGIEDDADQLITRLPMFASGATQQDLRSQATQA